METPHGKNHDGTDQIKIYFFPNPMYVRQHPALATGCLSVFRKHIRETQSAAVSSVVRVPRKCIIEVTLFGSR